MCVGDHEVEFDVRITCDLKSFWALLGIPNGKHAPQCIYCDTKIFTRKGKPRTFPDALIKVNDPEMELVFDLLHARLRIGTHRYDILFEVCVSEKGSQTQAEASRIFDSEGLKPWRKDATKTKKTVWLQGDDVVALEEKEPILAKFEKVSASIWSDMYSLLHQIHDGISKTNQFEIHAKNVLKRWVAQYGKSAVRIYEHMAVFHVTAVQQKLGLSLGRFENQAIEGSHHETREEAVHVAYGQDQSASRQLLQRKLLKRTDGTKPKQKVVFTKYHSSQTRPDTTEKKKPKAKKRKTF